MKIPVNRWILDKSRVSDFCEKFRKPHWLLWIGALILRKKGKFRCKSLQKLRDYKSLFTVEETLIKDRAAAVPSDGKDLE
jgi:hypothetical protein